MGRDRGDSLDHLQYGLQYGIVCQNKDPQGLGRVKVRLPWLDQGDMDQTHWAQLVTPMGGAPGEVTSYIASESARWSDVVKTAGVRMD